MKTHSFFYLFIVLLNTSCTETNKSDSKKSDYYSTRIDTTFSMIDRTEISSITRYIYEKESKDLKKSLTFSKQIRKEYMYGIKYRFSRVNTTNLEHIRSDFLVFDNVTEIKSLFDKIDSLGIGESLKERKKTMYYEIDKRQSGISVKQFSGAVDFSNDWYFRNSEYDGIKSSFEKHLLEYQ